MPNSDDELRQVSAEIKKVDGKIRLRVPRNNRKKWGNVAPGRLSNGLKKWLGSPAVIKHFESSYEAITREVICVGEDSGGMPRAVRLPDEEVQEAVRRPDVNENAFANPYSFVPAPPRPREGPFGDGPPPGHHAYVPDAVSGSITVKLTTVTPLVVLDDLNVTRDEQTDHHTFALRRSSDQKPLFPASGLKGALRSSFEAITNSRFGVFFDQDKRVGYREGTDVAPHRVPVRIEGTPDELRVRVLRGLAAPPGGTTPCVPAAWLPVYGWSLPEGEPDPGEEVFAWVEFLNYEKPTPRGSTKFGVWRVVQWARSAEGLSTAPPRRDHGRNLARLNPAVYQRIRGWYYKSNNNIKGKHDERVFFDGVFDDSAVDDAGAAPLLGTEAIRWYRDVVADYRRSHSDADIWRRPGADHPSERIGNAPGETAWSRHLYENNLETVHPRMLCYAECTGGAVSKLYPVTISRSLAEVPPRDLLDPSLRPAENLAEFSAADRVFGWVRDGKRDDEDSHAGYAGHVRIHPPTCDTPAAQAVAKFDAGNQSGVPLAILSTPKVQQGRFYVGTADGRPLPDGTEVRDTYRRSNRLRGRKFYLHHAGAPERQDSGYWDNPTQDRTQSLNEGWYQEYRRAASRTDSQNRTLRGWVNPGTEFSVRIDVWNLSRAEVGALLWLLSDQSGHLRAGFGKPLGFGSLTTEITEAALATNEAVSDAYRGWSHAPSPDENLPNALIEDFKAATSEAAACAGFPDVPWIRDYVAIANGNPRTRVHYPRLTPVPHHEGKNFEWFSTNERNEKLSLPEPGPNNRFEY